jgi:hypothetical protein
MSLIPFTDRELRRAWRELSSLAGSVNANARKNTHRLLLFYAVECGLKAVWLKRNNLTLFDTDEIEQTGHDLRQLLKDLGVSGRLSLPKQIHLSAAKDRSRSSVPRSGSIAILHQVWRYGGECMNPTDAQCDQQLQKVSAWIAGELK